MIKHMDHTQNDNHCIHIHGVSVGEMQSTTSLVSKLLDSFPDKKILMTCWTKTALGLAEKLYRDNPRITVTRLPIDLPWNHNSFYKHHNVQASIWIDSEIWPGWLLAMRSRNIPCLLINGRMSGKSYKRWSYFKPIIKKVLSWYARIDAQSAMDCERFTDLGGNSTIQPVNLKYLRPARAIDEDQLAKFRASIGDRPVIMHASTHEGDETMAFEVHQALQKQYPNILSIVVPRHPHRAEELMTEALASHLSVQLRSQNDEIAPDTDIFMGNTIGEMGLFYALSTMAIMGKSFNPDHKGGQNPIEPGQMACTIICGPYMTNFPGIMDDFRQANALVEVADKSALIQLIDTFLSNKEQPKTLADNALNLCDSKLALGPQYLGDIVDFIKDKIAQSSTH